MRWKWYSFGAGAEAEKRRLRVFLDLTRWIDSLALFDDAIGPFDDFFNAVVVHMSSEDPSRLNSSARRIA